MRVREWYAHTLRQIAKEEGLRPVIRDLVLVIAVGLESRPPKELNMEAWLCDCGAVIPATRQQIAAHLCTHAEEERRLQIAAMVREYMQEEVKRYYTQPAGVDQSRLAQAAARDLAPRVGDEPDDWLADGTNPIWLTAVEVGTEYENRMAPQDDRPPAPPTRP